MALGAEAHAREAMKEDAKRSIELELGKKVRKGVDGRTDLGKFIDYLPQLDKALKAGPGALESYNDRAEYYGEEPLNDALEKALKEAVANCLAEVDRLRKKLAERRQRFKKPRGRPPVSADRRELEEKAITDLMNCADPPHSRNYAAQLVHRISRPKA